MPQLFLFQTLFSIPQWSFYLDLFLLIAAKKNEEEDKGMSFRFFFSIAFLEISKGAKISFCDRSLSIVCCPSVH